MYFSRYRERATPKGGTMFSHDSATNGSPHVVLRDDLLAAYPFLCVCPMVTGIVRGASFLDIGSAVFFYILEEGVCLKLPALKGWCTAASVNLQA